MSKTPIETRYGNFQNDTSWYKHANEQNAGELVYLVLGLVGEAGEFADAVKKIVRECGVTNVDAFDQILLREGVRNKLIDELGDTLWYMNKIMMFLGISQAELMTVNTLKLYERLSARNKSNLTELEWPFDVPYEEIRDMMGHHLMPEKDKDEV